MQYEGDEETESIKSMPQKAARDTGVRKGGASMQIELGGKQIALS